MPEEIKAPLTGTVWKIETKVGDALDEDDVIMILESMKMEIPVETPVDGELLEIRVKEGDSILEGQVLAVVEED
jgi:acetyl-CoA carboxylase biotin carboxyl carrier protein